MHVCFDERPRRRGYASRDCRSRRNGWGLARRRQWQGAARQAFEGLSAASRSRGELRRSLCVRPVESSSLGAVPSFCHDATSSRSSYTPSPQWTEEVGRDLPCRKHSDECGADHSRAPWRASGRARQACRHEEERPGTSDRQKKGEEAKTRREKEREQKEREEWIPGSRRSKEAREQNWRSLVPREKRID